jgi:hypothetical protein
VENVKIPKFLSRSKPLWFAVTAAAVLTTASLMTVVGQRIDEADVPSNEQKIDPKTEKLEDYRLRFYVYLVAKHTGDGYGANVDTTFSSSNWKREKLGGNVRSPGPEELWTQITWTGCKEDPSWTNQNYLFPADFTVYFPDKTRTANAQYDYCVSDKETSQVTYELITATKGFGDYEVRGNYIDGEVVYCGFLQKCWKYHDNEYVEKFTLKKESNWWF